MAKPKGVAFNEEINKHCQHGIPLANKEFPCVACRQDDQPVKVKTITVKQAGAELLKILALGSGRDPFACADRIDQDDLYEIQERLLALAEKLVGPNAVEKKFPYLYETVNPTENQVPQ